MSSMVGREIVISKTGSGPGPATLIGILSKNLNVNDEPIDISNDDDAGFRTLLAKKSLRSLDMEIEAVLKDPDVVELSIADDPVQGTYSVDLGDLGTIAGTFQFSPPKISGESGGRVTYTFTMMSSGTFSYTPDSTA